ncbi:hypothetical protein NL676_013333 [Syzygium grande]|nr:hypothetical protein NL676_013333 [Syzygium grande]
MRTVGRIWSEGKNRPLGAGSDTDTEERDKGQIENKETQDTISINSDTCTEAEGHSETSEGGPVSAVTSALIPEIHFGGPQRRSTIHNRRRLRAPSSARCHLRYHHIGSSLSSTSSTSTIDLTLITTRLHT